VNDDDVVADDTIEKWNIDPAVVDECLYLRNGERAETPSPARKDFRSNRGSHPQKCSPVATALGDIILNICEIGECFIGDYNIYSD
jgi:hypothetical protein